MITEDLERMDVQGWYSSYASVPMLDTVTRGHSILWSLGREWVANGA